MPKIQLTIETSYLPNWGTREGVRELVQNARDAETEHYAPMTVTYEKGLLRLHNEGTTLSNAALLLGHTSKANRSDTIGKFGEGLKLGILALVRAGHVVTIRTGSEVWTPTLEFSQTFGAQVLTFDIAGGRKYKNRVSVEIGGISAEDWAEYHQMFLFLNKVPEENQIKTYSGTLLLGKEMKGKVFVKGIFVQHDPQLQYGYDLTNAELDRDRKMIESYNLKYKTQNIQFAALSVNSSLFDQFNTALLNPPPELQNLEYTAHQVPEEARQFVHARFLLTHGENAVPVANLAEAEQIEHLGVRGVITTDSHRAVLQKTMGTIHTIRERLEKESTREYTLSDLSDAERVNLEDAFQLVNGVASLDLANLHIVDFRSPGMEGQYVDGTVSLARKLLADPDLTLSVLIHEVAHDVGGDGSKSHIQKIEDLWTKIVRNLRRTSRFENRDVI